MSHALTGRPVMQKEPRYLNDRLLALCRGAPCMLHFPGCTGGIDGERPSVPCHSNWSCDGKGVGYKAHDHTAVPGCPTCHRMLDHSGIARTIREDTFREAQRKWWAYIWKNALVKVA